MCVHRSLAKRLAVAQSSVPRRGWASGVTTCSPLPPVVLQKATSPRASQSLADLARGVHDVVEVDVGCGIEVEHEASRHLRIAGLAVPGMQLDAAHLRDRDQPLDTVHLQVRLRVAAYFHQLQQVRRPRHRMPLEETLALDAVGRPQDRTRPPFEVRDHPLADGLEVAREIELGHAPRVARVRPQRLVGIRDADAEHALARRQPRPRWPVRIPRRRGALSSRSPLNAACRSMPEPVQPANAISATNSGFTQ